MQHRFVNAKMDDRGDRGMLVCGVLTWLGIILAALFLLLEQDSHWPRTCLWAGVGLCVVGIVGILWRVAVVREWLTDSDRLRR